MEVSQDLWHRASRGVLHRSPTITDGGVLLGYGTVLVRRSDNGYELQKDAERFLCLASIARRRPQSPDALHCLRRALASWQQGDKALAHIHLAFGGLPRIESVEQAWCLHQAEGLIDLGMAPRVLAKELGFAFAPAMLSRIYNPNEYRNPKARQRRVDEEPSRIRPYRFRGQWRDGRRERQLCTADVFQLWEISSKKKMAQAGRKSNRGCQRAKN